MKPPIPITSQDAHTSLNPPGCQDLPTILKAHERLIARDWKAFLEEFDLFGRRDMGYNHGVAFTSQGVLVDWACLVSGKRDSKLIPWPAFLTFYRTHE